MDNQNDLPEQENLSTTDLPEEEGGAPVIEQANTDFYSDDSTFPADGGTTDIIDATDSSTALPQAPQYKTVTVVFAFIFFAVTLAAFIVFAFSGGTFLYNLLVTSKDNSVEGTIGTIFATIFGLIYMIGAGVAQFPANIVSVILFKRLKGKANVRWKNVVFTVFFWLSVVMLVVLFALAITVICLALFGGK